MPKEAFTKLSKQKQDYLLDIAKEVYSNGDIEDVSTNDLVSAMKISRASFYLYFKDKEELFTYCMENSSLMLYEKLHEVIKEKKTVFDCALALFDYYTEARLGMKDFKFVGNIFRCMNSSMSKQLLAYFLHTPKYKELKELYFKTFKEKHLSSTSFSCLCEMLFQSFMSSVAYFFENNDRQTAKALLLYKIDILKNGVC